MPAFALSPCSGEGCRRFGSAGDCGRAEGGDGESDLASTLQPDIGSLFHHEQIVCISGESNPGHIDGNDVFCH